MRQLQRGLTSLLPSLPTEQQLPPSAARVEMLSPKGPWYRCLEPAWKPMELILSAATAGRRLYVQKQVEG